MYKHLDPTVYRIIYCIEQNKNMLFISQHKPLYYILSDLVKF